MNVNMETPIDRVMKFAAPFFEDAKMKDFSEVSKRILLLRGGRQVTDLTAATKMLLLAEVDVIPFTVQVAFLLGFQAGREDAGLDVYRDAMEGSEKDG